MRSAVVSMGRVDPVTAPTDTAAPDWLAALPDPVIGFDVHGRIEYWNGAAEESYGIPAPDAIGRPARTLLQTLFPAPLKDIMSAFGERGTWTGNLVQRTARGRTLVVESRWVARYDETGTLVGGFALEREHPFDRLVPEGGQLSGALAHDLNNALAIIVNYTSLVGTGVERLPPEPTDADRATLRRDLQEIRGAADRAAQLTHLLVPLARRDPAPAPPLQLGTAVDELRALLQRVAGADVRLRLGIEPNLWPVAADVTQVRELLVNQAATARKTLPAGEALAIELANLDLDGAAGTGLPSGRHVRLTVSDSVVGGWFVALLPAAA